jgi:hypothetical protein
MSGWRVRSERVPNDVSRYYAVRHDVTLHYPRERREVCGYVDYHHYTSARYELEVELGGNSAAASLDQCVGNLVGVVYDSDDGS